MMQSQLFYTYNYMVKVRLFWWWCCVCCIGLSTLCIIILQARHDHNNIVPCGMIKVFWTELNWTELNGLRQSTILDNGHQNKIKIKDSHSVLWFWIRSHLSPHRPPIFTQNIFFFKLLPTYFGLQNTGLIFLSWFGYLHQQFAGVDLVVVTRKYIRQLFKQHNSFSRKNNIQVFQVISTASITRKTL